MSVGLPMTSDDARPGQKTPPLLVVENLSVRLGGKMVLDHLTAQIPRGEISALDAIDALLCEELTLREGRRVKAALKMGRLTTVKTLAGFDFAFQPSLDRNRILTLAGLAFIDRHEVVNFLGQPGCGKTHLAIALAVEAVKAGRSVYFTTLAELIGSLHEEHARHTEEVEKARRMLGGGDQASGIRDQE